MTRLLFIHHSCGGQLLASAGPERSRGPCLYEAHPHGGGLRARLEGAGVELHEASYGSQVGERTDLFDWPSKFRNSMERLLATDENDRLFPDARRNDVVLWKSCFPNSAFSGAGGEPGREDGPELTLANARAALGAALRELAKRPETRFVYLTAPPLARVPTAAWKRPLRALLGRSSPEASARLAREFNAWVCAPEGWLKGYEAGNVSVFDYYGVLADADGFLRYVPELPGDSHPSREGNERAAELLFRHLFP